MKRKRLFGKSIKTRTALGLNIRGLDGPKRLLETGREIAEDTIRFERPLLEKVFQNVMIVVIGTFFATSG